MQTTEVDVLMLQLFWAVNVTVYVPGAEYEWVWGAVVSEVIVADPSPKFQLNTVAWEQVELKPKTLVLVNVTGVFTH